MISVVIPTHNRADLLMRAVQSAVLQTYKDIEIIVVSDGSTDNTAELMRVQGKKDTRISFIEYHPAGGGNTARNLGVECASGEYVAFLDDDDEWMPNKLEKQMKVFAENPDIGLVCTGITVVYVDEKIRYNSIPNLQGDLRRQILLKNVIGTTSSVIVKKNLVLDTGGFDTKLIALQDYDLWIRICQRTKVGVVNEACLNYYNYTKSKQVSSDTIKYSDAFIHINKKYYDWFSELDLEEQRMKRYYECMLLANKSIRNKDGKASTYLKQALRIKRTKEALLSLLFMHLPYRCLLWVRSLWKIRI